MARRPCHQPSAPGPQPGKVAVAPYGQQDHRGVGVHRRVKHQVVAMQVFAQRVRCAGRQRRELGQRLGQLRRPMRGKGMQAKAVEFVKGGADVYRKL